MKMNYKITMISCFAGYVVQAIINNFIPLLFITLQNTYDISLNRITMLITVNFGVQLLVDMMSTVCIDKVGYRRAIVAAHMCAAAGLILLTVLPEMIDPYAGILIAVVTYAIGGGLIEVLVSPIMESCPTNNKETAMSLLHSFYCWGQVGVVLVSTIFFQAAGLKSWRILAYIWAAVPLINGMIFLKTPIAPLLPEEEKGMTLKELFVSKTFWVLFLMMLCAGASEQGVSQWASVFAEQGLGISKAAGDLAGPMTFAVLMGISRAVFGKYGEKMNLDIFMKGSSVLCVCSYLLICFAPSAVVSMVGCALCGLSVGIMWPGTFSKASASLRTGGTAMFALLALAGDVGCSGGPTLVGLLSDAAGTMKTGILAAVIFPVLMVICLTLGKRYFSLSTNKESV